MLYARQKDSFAPIHRNRRAFPEHNGGKVFFEGRRQDRPRDDARELAFRPTQSVSDDGCPIAGYAATHEFDLDRLRAAAEFESLEIVTVRNFDVRYRPYLRGVDQCALGVEYVDGR